MVLYRFLFAPVLLAVALFVGGGDRGVAPAPAAGDRGPSRALRAAEIAPGAPEHATREGGPPRAEAPRATAR